MPNTSESSAAVDTAAIANVDVRNVHTAARQIARVFNDLAHQGIDVATQGIALGRILANYPEVMLIVMHAHQEAVGSVSVTTVDVPTEENPSDD